MLNIFGLKNGCRLQRKDTFFQYSSEEQFTGEYLGTKKIYTRTLTVATANALGTVKVYDVSTNFGNVDTIWLDNRLSFFRESAGQCFPLPHYESANERVNGYFINGTATYRVDMWNHAAGTLYETFLYTKK